ncbi:MAG: serine/threonine-protein kinase [Polyangiales bacterium]
MDEELDLAGTLMRERVRARLLGATPRRLRIGRFELERACGRGGEGQVFAARDTVGQTRVALKCLNSVRMGEQAALQHEFRALSGVVHPNLVSMHELFCVDGAWFFTMELLDGVDLVRHVGSRPDRTAAIRDVLRQLLSGLAAMHDAGFVHRDVKPSNVVVEASGRVVLVDFGLVIEHAVREARSAGTPAYMAPEQEAGAPPAPAADLFAVGAILFELLSGRRLARTKSPLRSVLDGDPVLVALCHALLAHEPAQRPSAHEALARLDVRSTRQRPAREARFVGRAPELARLRAAWSELRGPRIMLVHGESGIGKSALLAEFARELPYDARVFRGRCYERESTPYKVFDGLLAELPAREDTQERAFAEMRARLRRFVPLVLIVDDLQWADLDSLTLLEALFARGSDLPILLVGNYRRGEERTNAFLSALLAPRLLAAPLCAIEQLALEPLASDDARALVEQLAERRVEDAQIASARGVPFALMEVALGRVAIGVAADGLLELLSVAGRPLPIALALRAAEAPFAAALELVAARCARFRDLAGERCLEPYHDRVRVRVADERARTLHLRIADGMEALGANAPLARVEHLRAAGEDERAALLALQAAELACAQLAWSRAADLFAFALALGHGDRHRLADVLAFAGRHEEAAQAYLCAEPASETRRLAAQQLLRAGQTRRGMELLWSGLASTGVRLPRSTLAASLTLLPSRVKTLLALRRVERTASGADQERLLWLGMLYRELWLTHPVQSALAHDAYCREAMRGDARERVMALTMEAVVRTIADGPSARTEHLLRRADRVTEGSPYEVALQLIARGIVALHGAWRPRLAIAPLERADALLAACPGTQFEREWAGFSLDYALELTGQLSALTELVRARQQRDPRHPMRVISVPLVMLLEDRADDALALLSAPRPRMAFLDHIALSRGVSAWLYRGQPLAAQLCFEEGHRALRFELATQSRVIRESTAFERARCAAALYVATRDERYQRAFVRHTARRLPPLGRARQRMLEASMAWADGRHAACSAMLREARAEFERGQCGHGVACARYREAQLDGNDRALAGARSWFVEQGVSRPERWLNLSGYWG